jgi:hypothetical protein
MFSAPWMNLILYFCLGNVVGERDALWVRRDGLTGERDALWVRRDGLTGERDIAVFTRNQTEANYPEFVQKKLFVSVAKYFLSQNVSATVQQQIATLCD